MVDRAALEMQCTARYRGFESLPLRQLDEVNGLALTVSLIGPFKPTGRDENPGFDGARLVLAEMGRPSGVACDGQRPANPLSLPLNSPLHFCTGRRPICTLALSHCLEVGARLRRVRSQRKISEPGRIFGLMMSVRPRTPRSGAPTPDAFLPPATRGRHPPPETIPTFALLHRPQADLHFGTVSLS